VHAHEQAHQGKLIDRTQGLLMAHQQLDEPPARTKAVKGRPDSGALALQL